MNDRPTVKTACKICGKVPEIPAEPRAIIVPVETCTGERLEPGIYCICAACMRQVGFMERAIRGPPGGIR